ncbi:hypothetical protein RFI_28087 [Reticulomyxa filosa]|uniref:Uncharacterized protein n=1 Tax=Reticulomyxa filosa TaxID=46433 RepID=X6M5V0_RETFI|nr:hypothetical protein RFI_28087 [Reticulomyxa filosa]|eukprot:ETO09304.1 hypothetical protein RFI_28087 [Reticulomyxa filosa]
MINELYNILNGSIPKTIGNLINLRKLHWHANELTGSVPSEIGRMSELDSIFLYNNQFNFNIKKTFKIIQFFIVVKIIEKFNWSCTKRNWKFNKIKKIGNLTNLRFLAFGPNNLSGTIPPEIGNLINIRFLDLSENSFYGTIPNTIGNLTDLISLLLNQNKLIGTIPVEIGNCWNLSILELSRNWLTGTIPSEIGNLQELQFLILEKNELNGTIPKEIENLWFLQYLILGYNKLTGELPQLDILSFLTLIDLNNNMLTGTLPFPDSYNWDNLIMLSLEKNMLNGNLPKLPNKMYSTLIITLHMNKFSDQNLHNWLNELFQKAPELQILSIYNNPHLTGYLPNSIYNTNIVMFLAHGCEINGILPWNNSQGNIQFATLLQNRLSGAMPNNLIQTTDVKNISNVTFIYNDSIMILSFNINTKLKNGLYLLGNRFSESKQWYEIFNNKELPTYVSYDEKNAKNLYITKGINFIDMIITGFIIIIILFLFLRKLRRYLFIKQFCGNNIICFKIQKLPNHIGFKQMKIILKWFNNLFTAIIISCLIIIYILNTTYYKKGYLLSHFSLAYFENPSLIITILLIIIILLSNIIILIYAFKWIINPPFIINNNNNDNNNSINLFTWQKGITLFLLFLGWILIVIIVLLYFAFESLPNNNTLHISSNLIYTIQGIMSLALSLHNSLIAPNLSIYTIEFIFYIINIQNRKIIQKLYSYVALFLQTLVCIIIPLIFASYFYNNCGRHWIYYWETCSGKDSNEAIVSYHWIFYDIDSCIREILEKWGNIMVAKMAINIFLPWIRLPNIRAFLFQCKSLQFLAGSNELNFETVGLFVNVELVILLGLFCPLIVPLCAMAIISNILNFQYLLNIKSKHLSSLQENLIEKDHHIYKLSDEIPAFPISILIIPFLFQQIIWTLSGALSNNIYSHLIKNIFGYAFIIIDICFIIIVIIVKYFYGIQIQQYKTSENKLTLSSIEQDQILYDETEYHQMQPMETLKKEL